MNTTRETAGLVVATIATGSTVSTAVTIPVGMAGALIEVPTITSGSCTVQVSHDGTTFQALYNNNTQAGRTTSSTGGFTMSVEWTGRPTGLKVVCGASQLGARSFNISFSS